ncbi:hypothetical protein HNV08_12230 [Winogradskyella eckloniae]|uniref:phosphotransferase family protein n=1 Tax=Winogradskyella eckloniae TaxID=1089306 RepID=UPI0015640A05|nr:hypothetical protein [Winogradskyella eckloniae]NRD20815.1 hypothetical protein [Winogradskyella eckloniae]
MKIRRYDVDDIFETLDRSQIIRKTGSSRAKFICIPRYNVCIHLKGSSIRFFFKYVYKVRTYKTYLIWFFLKMIAILPSVHFLLNILGMRHKIKSMNVASPIDWNKIDVIYVEWHFFGVFSHSHKTVTHVLAKEAYAERFQNELIARQMGNQFKNLSKVFPKLLKISDDPKYYVEELAVGAGKQFIDESQLVRAQKKIKKLNRKTLKKTVLDAYYLGLINKLGTLNNASILNALETLKASIERDYLNKNIKIDLALVHGDFNAGQILSQDGNIKIIDWGDGGLFNRFFDYISIAIYKSPNHTFSSKYFPNELSVLKPFFSNKLMKEKHMELYVRLTLLEILVISKGEFEANEGAYERWLTAVNYNT